MAPGKQKFGMRHLIPETQKEFARQLQRVRGGTKSKVYEPGLTLESAGRVVETKVSSPVKPFKRTSETAE